MSSRSSADHTLSEAGPRADRGAGKLLAAVGGVLAAIGATSCCVIPFVLFTLGVSGAWIGNLTALAPDQPYFVAVTIAFLVGGFVMIYRKPKAVCADGTYCATPASTRLAKFGLWVATALVLAALMFPHVARFLLEP